MALPFFPVTSGEPGIFASGNMHMQLLRKAVCFNQGTFLCKHLCAWLFHAPWILSNDNEFGESFCLEEKF